MRLEVFVTEVESAQGFSVRQLYKVFFGGGGGGGGGGGRRRRSSGRCARYFSWLKPAFSS